MSITCLYTWMHYLHYGMFACSHSLRNVAIAARSLSPSFCSDPPSPGCSSSCAGHSYVGHSYTGHNYICHHQDVARAVYGHAHRRVYEHVVWTCRAGRRAGRKAGRRAGHRAGRRAGRKAGRKKGGLFSSLDRQPKPKPTKGRGRAMAIGLQHII